MANLNCPLCFKAFSSPRILPCLHTFCETCLGNHIKSSDQDSSTFRCPICTTCTVPPDIYLTKNKWAGSFPLDCVIQSLLKQSGADGKLCDICKLDDESTTAEFWCVDCQEKLCESCNRDHKRIKISRHHNTVPFDEIKTKTMALKLDFDQECLRHSGKKQEVICIDHRELCCLVCFSEHHRQCSTKNIDDGADEQTKRFAMKNILEIMRKMTSEVDSIVCSKSDSVQQLANEKDKILKDMDVMIDRAIRKLNDLRNAFKNEADQIHGDKKESLMKNDESVQWFKTNVANANYILGELEKHGSVRQKFVVFENILSQITSHYQQLVSDLQDDTEIHLKMTPNNFIRDIEETLKSVGNIEVSSKPPESLKTNLTNVDEQLRNLKSKTQLKSAMCAAQVEKCIDFMTSSVTFIKAVTRQELGEKPWITGCAVLNDGRLIIADLDNYRLIQINDKYGVERKYNTDGYPTDVVAGNYNNELYIAVNHNSVYRCTLDTKLKVVNKITAPSGTTGLAVYGDSIIAGTKSEVVILTFDGSKLGSFPKSGIDSYVAVSPTSRTLYHIDSDAVVCRAYDGEEKFRYQHAQLKTPRGICLDINNYIYVCGRDSGNLHQISPDGQRSRIILNKLRNISQPWSVIFISQRNEIIVSSYREDTAFEVYRLGE